MSPRAQLVLKYLNTTLDEICSELLNLSQKVLVNEINEIISFDPVVLVTICI